MNLDQMALISRTIRRATITVVKLYKWKFSGVLVLNLISLACSSSALILVLGKKHPTLKNFGHLMKIGEILIISGACVGCLSDKIEGKLIWFYPFI